MRFLSAPPPYDLTYSDVFLAPARSGVSSRLDVSLVPDDGTGATLPVVAANMNSVTGPRLAATLARRGGLGVLPQDLPRAELEDAIAWVKAQSTRWDSAIVLAPKATVWDAQRLVTGGADRGVVVVDKDGAVQGTVTAAALAKADPGTRLRDLLAPAFASIAPTAPGPEELFHRWDALLDGSEHEFAAVVEDDRVIGTASRRSLVRQAIYAPALDAQGRLRVAAAIGINGDVASRARDLAALGADVLVLDTAHGHQEGMLHALETVAGLDLGLPLVAGNVVTAEATRDLVRAGASIVKVGVGPGAMCTTRMMTAVGRPQFSAVLETADAAHQLGAHVWADGGVRYPRDVALALAAGASSVMIGSWFAGTIEAPGVIERGADGALFKQSWGMASTKAVSTRFGDRDPWELARKELFAEGISSSRILIDPLRPGVEDLLDMITTGVRSSFTYAGAADLVAFRERATVGVQSAAGYEEGKPLPVGW
ncbi:GMP reductase [Amnibacterium setariae]|uniref:GMP reductase n=1 Tax=Amnibacterium setariae TaxID=2306585 RepID=A0A3A1U3P3_9MICO|nr:GuaB1 family IMP dehydrogenase-related protein [Amnibacterium setariae]RIX31002.1 GuaB1 family IMP dehydrogenase-related protein [Amnibacterium setariae]